MTKCERCPEWMQAETEPQVKEVIVPGLGKMHLCDKHNPWVTEGKSDGETLCWREDPHMQGAV